MCGTSKWLPGTQKALPGWGNTIGTPQEHPVNHSFLNFFDEIPYTKNVENNLEVKKKKTQTCFYTIWGGRQKTLFSRIFLDSVRLGIALGGGDHVIGSRDSVDWKKPATSALSNGTEIIRI